MGPWPALIIPSGTLQPDVGQHENPRTMFCTISMDWTACSAVHVSAVVAKNTFRVTLAATSLVEHTLGSMALRAGGREEQTKTMAGSVQLKQVMLAEAQRSAFGSALRRNVDVYPRISQWSDQCTYIRKINAP
jgi:hypothetical protein